MAYEKPNVLVLSGFRDKGIHDLADSLRSTGEFADTRVMPGCPVWHAATDSHKRVQAIVEVLDKMGENVWLVAHSAGAHYSLDAARRRGFRSVHGVLVNGALHPDVNVKPPPGHFIFHLFARQYAMREALMRQCLGALAQAEPAVREQYLTVVSPDDRIVPPDAQRLPGVPSVDLPLEIRGHGMSKAKIAAVTRIIVERIRQQQC